MRLAKTHLYNRHRLEPIWHIQLALLSIALLQFLLDTDLIIGSRYGIVGAEIGFILLLAFIKPNEKPTTKYIRRSIAFALITIITVTNLSSLTLVIYDLFHANTVGGRGLILSAISIYITNILVFALWYWELDSDGAENYKKPDFLFIQMHAKYKENNPAEWQPTFFDYLYFSATNASNLSPNDTAPLTHRAKALTLIQIIISMTIVLLVVSRAINILS